MSSICVNKKANFEKVENPKHLIELTHFLPLSRCCLAHFMKCNTPETFHMFLRDPNPLGAQGIRLIRDDSVCCVNLAADRVVSVSLEIIWRM